MRVLLLDQYGELGGAQHGFLEAAEGFAQHGWEAHAALPEGQLWEKLRPHCASLTVLPCGPFHSVTKTPADALRFALQFREQTRIIANLIRHHRIDVVYANGPRVVPAAAWAHGKVPLVFHSHSIVTQPSVARLTREALRRSGATIIASSHFVARWLEDCGPIDVIYNGIRALPFRPERASYTRIGVLGRIAPEKGQHTFVEAAKIAVRANPAFHFTICGGPVIASSTYFDRVRVDAGDLIEFQPWTYDLPSFFAGIDILAVPSEGVDANPRVIPEAYASGVPVLAFDSGGVSELLEDGVTGILVRERSATALASAIINAVQTPSLLREFAEAGRRRWEQRYTLPRFQSEVCDVLESRVNPRVRASAIA
jgi:glycosyltransferase involved in cell wall biosynthesis